MSSGVLGYRFGVPADDDPESLRQRVVQSAQELTAMVYRPRRQTHGELPAPHPLQAGGELMLLGPPTPFQPAPPEIEPAGGNHLVALAARGTWLANRALVRDKARASTLALAVARCPECKLVLPALNEFIQKGFACVSCARKAAVRREVNEERLDRRLDPEVRAACDQAAQKALAQTKTPVFGWISYERQTKAGTYMHRQNVPAPDRWAFLAKNQLTPDSARGLQPPTDTHARTELFPGTSSDSSAAPFSSMTDEFDQEAGLGLDCLFDATITDATKEGTFPGLDDTLCLTIEPFAESADVAVSVPPKEPTQAGKRKRQAAPISMKVPLPTTSYKRVGILNGSKVTLVPVSKLQLSAAAPAAVAPTSFKPRKRIFKPVSKDMLVELYSLSQEDAAKQLGMGVSTLRQRCRDLGMGRWPMGRRSMSEEEKHLAKLKSSDALRAKLKEQVEEDAAKLKEQLVELYSLSQEDAAKQLGMGVSTLRQRCRDLGMGRWPMSKEEKHLASDALRAKLKEQVEEGLLNVA